MTCPDSPMLADLLSWELTTLGELLVEEDQLVYCTLDDIALELAQIEQEADTGTVWTL